MNVAESNIPVTMLREHLNGVPEHSLPPGFSIRWFQPGDEQLWTGLHLAAEPHREVTPLLFREQFGCDDRIIQQRQCFLLDEWGHAVGTGTAWFDDDFHQQRHGRVHWMAIVPEFQGRGLAKPLLTTICRRLKELGHDRAFLRTSTGRIPAIALYLRFGFVPVIRNPADDILWAELRKMIR